MNCSFIRDDSLTVENGTLFLPAGASMRFYFWHRMTTTKLMCFPPKARRKFLYLEMDRWSSFPPTGSPSSPISPFTCRQATLAVHPSSSVCFLSPSRPQSDSTDTHSHPSTLGDTVQAEIEPYHCLAPLLACTPSCS